MNFWHVHESKKSYDSINSWITINHLPAYIVDSKKYNLPEKMLEITFVSYFHEHVKNLFQRIHIILQVEMNFRHVHESKNSYESINGCITINHLPA